MAGKTKVKDEYLAIGKRLIELRESKGLSQQDAAKELNILHTTYQKYEYGISKPNSINLLKITTYFGCTPGWLIYGQGDQYSDIPINKTEKIPFNNINDLPENELDELLDKLERLSKNDKKRIISGLIVCTRRGDLDSKLINEINDVMLEFIKTHQERRINPRDYMIIMILHVLYRELHKEPNKQELMSLISALYELGKVFPCGVPLTPHEQMELFSWGRLSEQNEDAKDGE